MLVDRVERELTITTDLGDGAVPVVTVQAMVDGVLSGWSFSTS